MAAAPRRPLHAARRPLQQLLQLVLLSQALPRARAQLASPSSTASPGLNASAPGAWWINFNADMSGADLGNAAGFATADLCRATCVAFGPTCGGCVWDPSTALCWLKNAAGGWVYNGNRPGLVSSLLLGRLTAAVRAGIPSPSAAPTVSATQGFSMTATASPAASAVAASLVWRLAVDASTGLRAFSSTAGNAPSSGPVFVQDRNGCPGGALSLLNGAYATATGVVGLPSGNAPRTLAAWVQCSGPANTVLEWGGGGGATNGRSGLYMMTSVRGAGFVAQSNDFQTTWSACVNSWMHVAITYNGSTMIIYLNGQQNATKASYTPLATAVATQVWVGWNGVLSYNLGQLYGSGAPAAANVDDLRIYSTALSAAAVAQLAVYSVPCASVTPTPSTTPSATSSATATRTAAPTVTPTQTSSLTATLSTGATPSQTGAPTASAAPSPAVPVDSFTDFVCAPAGTARGVMQWGAYSNINGLNPNVWSPFDKCDSSNTVVAGPNYYLSAVNGASYCNLAAYSGHPQNTGACSFPATGYCAPTVRFTANRAYASLTVLASFCPGGGCGSQILATLRYVVNGTASVMWAANSTGTPPVAPGVYQGYVSGMAGLQNCSAISWSSYFLTTLVLPNVPAGAAVELRMAPLNGCNCGAFNYRLQISGTLASPSPTATQSGTGTASASQTVTASSTASRSAAATASVSSGASSSGTAAVTVSTSVSAAGTVSSTSSAAPTASTTATLSATASSSATQSAASLSSTQSRIPVSAGASSSDTAAATSPPVPSASQTPSSPASATSSPTAASLSPSPSLTISTSSTFTPVPSAAAPIIISGGADGAAAATGSTLPAVAGGAAAAVLIGCAVAIALLMRRRRDKKKLSRVKSEVAALRDFQKEAVASQRSLALALSEISALRETVAASTNPMHTAQAGSFSRLEPAAGLTGSSRAAAAAAAATMATPAQPRAVDAAEQHLSLARTPSERRAFSAVKRAEPPLAPGWKEASGTSGTPYWRNESTGLTSFSRPTVAGAPSPQAPQPAAAGDAPLLPGWTEHFSKSTGKNYWRHGDSGETTWTRPAVAAAAATEAAAAPGASLPPGWGERFSNSQQRPYWFTLSDPSRTVWERPTAPA